MTTINPTLPQEWKDNKTYNLGDTVYYKSIIYKSLINNNLNNNPKTTDAWKALDIYTKDETVMEHGQYSGDEEFWERDNVYIDGSGWVYINNENTGINVKGPMGDLSVKFEDLTPEQIEQLKGLRGIQGPEGPAGPQGEQGPMGHVEWDNLTPEQVEDLKGEPGASAYDIWIDQGHTGTEEDFLLWLQNQAITVDSVVNTLSTNPIQNGAITSFVQNYIDSNNLVIANLTNRIQALENQLTAVYNGQDIKFRFGITENGKYGYMKDGSSDTTPFDLGGNDVSSMYSLENGFTFTQNFGRSNNPEEAPISITSISDENKIQPTSFTLNASNNYGEDDALVLSSELTSAKTFTEAFDTKYYIFENHIYTGIDGYAFKYENMQYTDGQPLISNPSEDGTLEHTGFAVSPDQGPSYYGKLYVTVESINEESSYDETILYFLTNVTQEEWDQWIEYPSIMERIWVNKAGRDPLVIARIPKGTTQEIEVPLTYQRGFSFGGAYKTASFKITKMYYK